MLRLEDTLNLFSGYFLSVDMKTSSINYVQFGNKVIAEKISFKEFAEIFDKKDFVVGENFNEKDIIFFVTNPYIEGSFLFPFTKKDGRNEYYRIVKKSDYEKQETICYFEVFDDFNSLSALTDSLTAVYPRDVFEQFVSNRIRSSKNNKFYMLVIDIDNFKHFNDTYGHQVGDDVLKEVSKIYKELYPNGFIGRVGGDEFAIVDFDELNEVEIQNKCNRLMERVHQIEIDKIAETDRISITIGISFFPKHSDYASLFKEADNNLYEGKNSGKNKFVIEK